MIRFLSARNGMAHMFFQNGGHLWCISWVEGQLCQEDIMRLMGLEDNSESRMILPALVLESTMDDTNDP